jgi:hypothetical protein
MKTMTALQHQQVTGGVMVLTNIQQPTQSFHLIKTWFQRISQQRKSARSGLGAKYNPQMFRRN